MTNLNITITTNNEAVNHTLEETILMVIMFVEYNVCSDELIDCEELGILRVVDGYDFLVTKISDTEYYATVEKEIGTWEIGTFATADIKIS